MGSKLKATIALSPDVFQIVDQESKNKGETRSAVIETALRYWQRQKRDRALANGYQAMAHENKQDATKNLSLFNELESTKK